MTNKIINMFYATVAAVKSVFVKKTVAHSTEESFVESTPVAEEAKVVEVANVVASWVAKITMVAIAYVVVCNFPITILFVLEMTAIYKMIKWAANKIIA